MSNLDSLKVHIEEEIMLQEKRNSQTFISQGIHEIKVKLRDARSLFNTLHAKFKKAVEDWQAYEERMTQITQSVDEAEDELVKTQPTRQFTKIELLANMEQLQRTMNTLQVNLSDMQTLNNIVCTGASAASVVCLNKKLADVKYLIENVSFRLSYRVSELVAGNKWRKYNRALQKYEIESNWLCTMKEELRQCDNVTGTDDEIHHRLEICMEITKEANKHRDSFATLVDRVSHMQDKLPAVNVTRMNSDALRIKKKFSEYLARSKEIAEILLATLQQHLMDTQKQHQRWLDAARAKADQCQVITGDRYHLEAKLETIKELINSAGEGEQMKNLATAKIEALKDVLPKGRQAELEEQKRQAETEWQILWNAMQETRVKLEFSIEQCQANEKEYNVMLQWLKDTEALKRNEGVPQPDLQSKSHQFELLKTLAEDVVAHKSEFEAMRESSKNIGPSTGERRFALFTDQLVKRYGALVTSVEILVENCKQNVSDHEGYLQRYMECLEWIKGQQQGLDDCVDTPHNKEMLHAKLAFLSNLTSSNGSGLRCLNTAIESGERLYINTSNEGRDIIRNELKLLRDKWETFNEKLNEIKRKLQLSGMQWSSFDENVEQVEKCFTDFAEQYKNEDDEPMNTLHEKKSALQKNTTRYKNIVLYKTMLDSLSDTGSALATVKAKDKLKELHVKYGALCEIALSKVKKAEEDVNQHQELQDLHQQCRYWVYSTKDNIASCADSSGDRHVLQNKLDKVLDLLKSMRDGDAIASDFYVLAGNTIPNTGLEGQKVIQKDMEDIKETFVTLASRLESIKENLVHALHLVTTYDGLCDQLNTWLREHETANKEINDLKRSQGDKENQSEKLNKIEKEVNAQQRHFDELQDMVSHMEGVDSRLVNYSSQLNFRYETLRTNLQSAVIRWQNYVHEHQAYSTNYTKCTERLDTIQHRLEACAEMTDDRVDIEDGLRKLLMLDAEKEDCVKLIQHTVESGEKLHTSTSAEGKEIIRQELRMLRDLSEQVDDQLIYTQKKLKMCLVHLPTSSEIIEKPLHATDELLNDENNTSVVHMIDEIIYQRELIDDSELQTHIGGSPPPTPSSEEEVFDAINRDSVSAVGKDTCIHAALFPAPSASNMASCTTCPCSDEELIRLQKENLILQNRLLKKKLNEN
ncbi:muscle-specific protein 300 kDa-like isoform X2 [Dreissena polymorpha]|uniref:Nesprin-1 n=2 Tax=Dreissena polymorpha TaxID=45954 RepID=A0A9D4KU61_DREPO|nr:muscle-specific protein 300 kDa-like isoform X2 [Dreissena polymorpha]KAH3846187.1 hypothetical protein DPMN_088485 [Dreissena polymorpha]